MSQPIKHGVWPQPAQVAEGVWPPKPQNRILLRQHFDQERGIWVADFIAGPNPDGVTATNTDGMTPGTHYTLTSATQFTGA